MTDASQLWYVASPGTICITNTSITVRYTEERIFVVEWQGKPVPGYGYNLVLDSAKESAIRYMQQLMEIGLDP